MEDFGGVDRRSIFSEHVVLYAMGLYRSVHPNLYASAEFVLPLHDKDFAMRLPKPPGLPRQVATQH